MIDTSRPTRSTRVALGGALLATAVLAAGCGSAGPGAAVGGGTGQPTRAAGSGRSGTGTARPGVSGKIAEIDRKTLQVQGSTTQTAVTWTARTVFTQETASTVAAVRAGVCVVVRTGSGASSGAGTASAPAGSVPARPAVVTASTVSVSPPAKDGCAGFGAGGDRRGGSGVPGGGSGGPPGGRPSGLPSAASGGAGARTGFGRPVSGTVLGVTPSGFTVQVPEAGGPGAAARTVTVDTTASTTYTARRTVTAAAAKVGECAGAQGPTDSTGAMTATRIALSSATGGSCTQGFGGRG